MRAEIGNENLVVCLSEYLPISVFTLAFSRKRQKLQRTGTIRVSFAKRSQVAIFSTVV